MLLLGIQEPNTRYTESVTVMAGVNNCASLSNVCMTSFQIVEILLTNKAGHTYFYAHARLVRTLQSVVLWTCHTCLHKCPV